MGASAYTVAARVRSSEGHSLSLSAVQSVRACLDQATIFGDKREGGVIWQTTD